MKPNLIDLTCTAVNESSLGEDGLALFAPYGDARNVFTLNNPAAFREAFPAAVLVEEGGFTRVEGIQRITQANSAVIADAFNSMFAKVKRWVKGSPVYNRHPDSPGSEDTDMTVLGLVSRLEARPDGLYGFPVFSDAGADAVNGREKLFFSPRFSFAPTGVEGGRVVWEPTEFKSVGLTPNPNLAADAANNAPAPGADPKEHMNKTVLCGALVAAGVAIAADASDDVIAREIIKLGENSRLGATGANERESLKTENARLKQELADLRSSADNAAKTSRDTLLAAALADGRITAAEKDQWEQLLKADAVNGAAALGRLTKKVKTAPAGGTPNPGAADAANQTTLSPSEIVRAEIKKQINPDAAA